MKRTLLLLALFAALGGNYSPAADQSKDSSIKKGGAVETPSAQATTTAGNCKHRSIAATGSAAARPPSAA